MTRKVVIPRRFTIAPAKVTDYLLDPQHADGGPKCAFLMSFGFSLELAGALHRAINMHRIRENYKGWVEGY